MVSSRLNTKTTRASQSTQSTWLKHALMAQRSLIKGYEPRRKIYGVFGIIDSVVYQYLTLNNPVLYDWWILKTKKIFAIINNSLILV